MYCCRAFGRHACAVKRQAMLRKPPHILITTPESLYILLTSPTGRGVFRSVRTVISDEIHTLAVSSAAFTWRSAWSGCSTWPANRSSASASRPPSSRWTKWRVDLGGASWQGDGAERSIVPRPVTIVDAGYRKPLDFVVETVVEDLRGLAGDSVWPLIVPRIVDLIDQHCTTLIFVNNRRLAQTRADRINEERGTRGNNQLSIVNGQLSMVDGTHADLICRHHGSMSKETRLALEQALKAGNLPALVGTSSLELGHRYRIGGTWWFSCSRQRRWRRACSVLAACWLTWSGRPAVGAISTDREDIMEVAAVAGGTAAW